MPPLREFICLGCGHQFEDIIKYDDHDIQCPHCESKRLEKLFPLIGGYSMISGPSSTRPKAAGSKPRKSPGH